MQGFGKWAGFQALLIGAMIAGAGVARAQTAETPILEPACSGEVASGWVGTMPSSLSLEPEEKGIALRGYLNDGWVNGRILEKEDEIRLDGWVGSNPLQLTIRRRSPLETRILGRFGGGDSLAITIREMKPDEIRIGGFGRNGSVQLTWFRGRDGGLRGLLNGEAVTLNPEGEGGDPAALKVQGYLGMSGDFVELSARNCLDTRGWSTGLTTSELFALLILLGR
jgi:hypothetical protein